MVWHALHEGEGAQLTELAERYSLHPLHIEDCRHGGQSAKLEDGDNYMFAVFKPAYTTDAGDLAFGDFDVFLGPGYLITYEEIGCAKLRNLIDRHKINESLTNDQAFHRILDGIVDAYSPILDSYSEEIDSIEDQVLSNPAPDLLQRIFTLKRALIELRRILTQTRDLAGHLMRSDHELISPRLTPYFRDVYDHLSRHIETVEMSRDLLSGALDIYLSSVANRTNETMKVLTLLSTFALPSVALTSFFGMNFKFGMPLIESPDGLMTGTILALSITAILVTFLRYRKWI